MDQPTLQTSAAQITELPAWLVAPEELAAYGSGPVTEYAPGDPEVAAWIAEADAAARELPEELAARC